MALLSAQTVYGAVRGVPSAQNAKNTVFKGIPFAKPPIGELRFAPPVQTEAWNTELLCDHFAPACIQTAMGPEAKDPDFETSEDCLYLNVYTPANEADEKLPVLFWIYGGGFSTGRTSDPEFNGNHFNDLGAVVVTAAYRCGALGFFSHPELDMRNGFSGNLGLLDQIFALKWVQQNIDAFGGDPARVTVFGQSAGGMSTRMLLTSPAAHGLFSRAIIESGGGLNEADLVRTREDFTEMCQNAMAHIGWTFEDIVRRDALDVYRSLAASAKEISKSFELAFFQPFIDGTTLTDVPGKKVKRGEYMDIPIMCGTVSGDSWMFSRKVRGILDTLPNSEAYFRGFSFVPGEAWSQNLRITGGTPIYNYYMDRKQPEAPGGSHFNHGAPPFGFSTPHSSEIAYVFGTLDARNRKYTDYDYKLSEIMSKYWFNFASTGDPNGDGLPEWPKNTSEAPFAMHFGDETCATEKLISCAEEQHVIDYTIENPGMLEYFE